MGCEVLVCPVPDLVRDGRGNSSAAATPLTRGDELATARTDWVFPSVGPPLPRAEEVSPSSRQGVGTLETLCESGALCFMERNRERVQAAALEGAKGIEKVETWEPGERISQLAQCCAYKAAAAAAGPENSCAVVA